MEDSSGDRRKHSRSGSFFVCEKKNNSTPTNLAAPAAFSLAPVTTLCQCSTSRSSCVAYAKVSSAYTKSSLQENTPLPPYSPSGIEGLSASTFQPRVFEVGTFAGESKPDVLRSSIYRRTTGSRQKPVLLTEIFFSTDRTYHYLGTETLVDFSCLSTTKHLRARSIRGTSVNCCDY